MATGSGTSVYSRLGVRPIINAQGNRTVLGGSATTPAVAAAMEEANHTYVEMRELLEKSGEFIAEMLSVAAIDEEAFRRVEATERLEMERRLSSYREVAEVIDPSGRTAVVVDDGLATGSTAMAGVAALRARHATEVWVAVPVAPRDTTQMIEREADRVVVLSQPRYFGAVGAWYRDFGQTTDEEVRALLADSRLR